MKSTMPPIKNGTAPVCGVLGPSVGRVDQDFADDADFADSPAFAEPVTNAGRLEALRAARERSASVAADPVAVSESVFNLRLICG